VKIKTSELGGSALDWAVANAIGDFTPSKHFDDEGNLQRWAEHYSDYRPSIDWGQAGPIIEQYGISFREYFNPTSPSHGTFYARICRESGQMVAWNKKSGRQQTGPTPLIAAMRCFVASTLGDEVDVPEALL